MSRIERIGFFDAGGGEGFADWLIKLRAMLLHERLEEGHAEHFAFAFVNAGGQKFVDVIAQHVAVQEGTAAVGFHEQVDGGFFLGFATKDFGDDAFHFATVTLVEQAGAPLHQGVAADDERGQAAQAALDEFAAGDFGAVGSAEVGPGDHARHHQPHGAGGVGA